MAFEETPLVGASAEPSPIIVPDSRIVAPRGPRIIIPRMVWQRDPGMAELVEYFDSDRFANLKRDDDRFDKLSVAEVKEIEKIAIRCREDFAYASRNFFYISNKSRGDQLLKLLPGQQLIYEFMLRLKARGLLQKIMILKSRQLGCSTLIEALIAWRTMFFRNTNAIVVSYDAEHAASLFGIMQFIYDRMPWWLRPKIATREYQDGLHFDNPDYSQRRQNPGLNSKVVAQAANKRTGVGQGYRINAAHISEYADFRPTDAREIIEADLGNALAEEDPTMFAFLESTGKGTGNYSYDLWNKNVEMGDAAEWNTLFLPSFLDSSHFLPPPGGWKIEETEANIRDRVVAEWTRCDDKACAQYHERRWKTEDRADTICPTCSTGTLKPYNLSDGQAYWFQKKRKNAQKDQESMKKLLQEQCITSEDSFQSTGFQVFSQEELGFAGSSVRPPEFLGFLDNAGKMHGCNPKDQRLNSSTKEYYDHCYLEDCNVDHSYGDAKGENPLQLWELPQNEMEYVIGGDVSEGMGGDGDYSVAAILKVNRRGGQDHVVGVFRSNTIDPIAFARVLVGLGRWYNDALLSIERNRYDTTVTWCRWNLLYPNMYMRLNTDTMNAQPNQVGWLTTGLTKPRLYQMLRNWLRQKLFYPHSRNFAHEMKTFVKENYDGTKASAEGRSKDDEIMATMIALYTAHETDWDDALDAVAVKAPLTMEEASYGVACKRCEYEWPSNSAGAETSCPRCGCMVIEVRQNINPKALRKEDPERDVANSWPEEEQVETSYVELS